MPKKNVHVTRRQGKSWAVITEGSGRAIRLFRTQGKAIDFGKPIAQNNKAELVIHDVKNRIRDKDSYGPDPNPPKDKKH